MSKTSDIVFPHYRKSSRYLLAFLDGKTMFKIEQRGTNMNDGLCIDNYVTRKMVLSYIGEGKPITFEEFSRLYTLLFSAALQKMH